MDPRKSDDHSDLVDPKDPLGITLCTMTLKLLLASAASITNPRSPVPGVLGHRDSVRGYPGGVCDAQPGLALAAPPLRRPTAPLCCPVFCRYL